MHLIKVRIVLIALLLPCLLHALAAPVLAGMLGYPVPRQRALHPRFEIAGDSFKEDLDGGSEMEATSGRGLATAVLGLTDWSEIYARVGLAEFNVRRVGFSGDFGLAYGGGARLRLFRLSWGGGGLAAQYLRFTSNDKNNSLRDATWEEVDVALGLGSRRFGAFQFYGGGAYHRTEVTLNDQRTSTKFDSKIPGRLFLGVHIYPLADFPGGEFVVNVEARVLGEIPQVTLGLQYAF